MNNNVEIKEKEDQLALRTQERLNAGYALSDAQVALAVAANAVPYDGAAHAAALAAVITAEANVVAADLNLATAIAELEAAKAVEDISKTAFSNKTNLVPETISGSTEPIKQQYSSGTVDVGHSYCSKIRG